MKIAIKTLKGDQFQVEAEPTDTVLVVKQKVSEAKAEHVVDRQKLILAGKVLKDTVTVAEMGIKDTDFLVCMVTKAVAAKVPKPAEAPPPAVVASATGPAPAAIPATPAATLPATPAAPVRSIVPPEAPTVNMEAVASLTAMGFPEDECKNALIAANGNGDLAVEYLMSGIPEAVQAQQRSAATPAPTTPAAAPSPASGIEAFRQHPQFEQLKQLIQQNPAAMNQVLEAIGTQNPELLASIHANHDAFVAMMNEPIGAAAPAPAPAPDIASMMSGGAGGPNAFQMLQMLSTLPPEQRDEMAQSMGMSTEQLQGMMQVISSMPPDQLQQMMAGEEGGEGGDASDVVVHLTEDEMHSVNRLIELGFNQRQACQAFLACDKNEALAANLLLEGWGNDMDMDEGDMDLMDEAGGDEDEYEAHDHDDMF